MDKLTVLNLLSCKKDTFYPNKNKKTAFHLQANIYIFALYIYIVASWYIIALDVYLLFQVKPIKSSFAFMSF